MVKDCKNATIKPVKWLMVSSPGIYGEKLYWTFNFTVVQKEWK